MTLISILLGLGLERLYDRVRHWRRYEHFHDYVLWLRSRLADAPVAGRGELLLVLLGPLLAVGLLQSWLDDSLWGLGGLVFGVLVLVVCLGPRDLFVDIRALADAAASGDDLTFARLADESLALPLVPEPDARVDQVAGELLAEANRRIFGVLFWFALLGPLGAVLYRAVQELRLREAQDGDPLFAQAILQLLAVLDWIPARLTALSYALSGDFEGALTRWRHHAESAGPGSLASDAILAGVGRGALNDPGPHVDPDAKARLLESVSGLVGRALFVWVFVIALLVLAGLIA